MGKKITSRIKSFASKTEKNVLAYMPEFFAGAAISVFMVAIFMYDYVVTGLGAVIDFLFALTVIAVLTVASWYLGKLLGYIINRIPIKVFGFAAVIFGLMFLIRLDAAGYILVLIGGLAGLSFALVKKHGFKKWYSIVVPIVAFLVIIFCVIEVFSDGDKDYVNFINGFYSTKTPSGLADPSLTGKFKVKYLTYGSGWDKQRLEYNKPSIITPVYDASSFLNPSGIPGTIRQWYWGFNSKKYPLNARVWYPEGNGTFPLLLIVHGNHTMNEFSDDGYEYLGKLLASRGIITVSVDQNFLNGSWLDDFGQSENIVRGLILLEHLKNWRKWNSEQSNVFFGKVDTSNIFLAGHSRGGQAVAIAAAMNKLPRYHTDSKIEFNYGFNIKGIIQIAPNDPYEPTKGNPLKLQDINYLLIQGGHDADVFTPMGNRVYNRLALSDTSNCFKAFIYSYRSNHGQFNTSWGKYDFGYPKTRLLNVQSILDAEEQRKIAKVYISAFIETLAGTGNDYKNIFRDFRYALNWLPKDYYVSQYKDSQSINIADYEEDLDVTKSEKAEIEGKYLTAWSENGQTMRDNWNSGFANNVVYIGWNRNDTAITKGTPEYSFDWTNNSGISKNRILSFCLANNRDNGDKVPEFTLRLMLNNGKTVDLLMSEIGKINPPLKVKLYKWSLLNEMGTTSREYENMMQKYYITPELLAGKTGLLNNEIAGLSLIFDKTEEGEVMIDNLSFEQM